MIPINWFLILSAILFLIGVSGVLFRRNIIIVLMSLELILNSANINFITFSYYLNNLTGQIFSFFTITLAAAEIAVALAIIICLVRHKRTVTVDEIDSMMG